MPRITITISDELDVFLEEELEANSEFSSKADVMRHYIDRGREAESLEHDLEIAENRLKELRQQMYHQDEVEQKVDLLAKRIEETQRQQDAPFVVRWWRWFRRDDS